MLAYAPYADLLWFETNNPSVETAAQISRRIREIFPGKCVIFLLESHGIFLTRREIQAICL